MIITPKWQEKLQEDLTLWKHNMVIGYYPIKKRPFALEISSDASLTGRGAHCNGANTHGFWSKSERNFHINYL